MAPIQKKVALTKPLSKPILPLHILAELRVIWSLDPRLPSAASRYAWAALRKVDVNRVGTWFLRKKAYAKRLGTLIEGEYNLALDAPQVIPEPTPEPEVPAASTVEPSAIPDAKTRSKQRYMALAAKRRRLSPSPSPSSSPSPLLSKRIKREHLESDSDSDQIWIPCSDDTLVSCSSPGRLSSKQRAYSHLSSNLVIDTGSGSIITSAFIADPVTHGAYIHLPSTAVLSEPTREARSRIRSRTRSCPFPVPYRSKSPAQSSITKVSTTPARSRSLPIQQECSQTENQICNRGYGSGFTCALCEVDVEVPGILVFDLCSAWLLLLPCLSLRRRYSLSSVLSCR